MIKKKKKITKQIFIHWLFDIPNSLYLNIVKIPYVLITYNNILNVINFYMFNKIVDFVNYKTLSVLS